MGLAKEPTETFEFLPFRPPEVQFSVAKQQLARLFGHSIYSSGEVLKGNMVH